MAFVEVVVVSFCVSLLAVPLLLSLSRRQGCEGLWWPSVLLLLRCAKKRKPPFECANYQLKIATCGIFVQWFVWMPCSQGVRKSGHHTTASFPLPVAFSSPSFTRSHLFSFVHVAAAKTKDKTNSTRKNILSPWLNPLG